MIKIKSREKLILEVGKYIVEHNATIEQTSINFNRSTSSIKKYINDPGNLQKIDMELYNEVKKIQSKLIEIGTHLGGKNGKRKPKHEDTKILKIAKIMIDKSFTILEAAAYFDIPPSTLHESLGRISDKKIKNDLKNLFLENLRNRTQGRINNEKIRTDVEISLYESHENRPNKK